MLRPARGAATRCATSVVFSLTLLTSAPLGAQEDEAVANVASTPAVAPPEAAVPGSPRRLVLRTFHLFAAVPAEQTVELRPRERSARLFHEAGDPDSLFTFFGSGGPHGELRLRAALEVNDIVLRAMTPDFRLDPSDPHPRGAGDYRALDAKGRPYQLRLGARLVW